MEGYRRPLTLIILTLVFLLPISLTAQESEQRVDPSLVVERFNVGSDGDELTLPVIFKGKTYRFVVDTGADHTIFDKSFRPHLGDVKDAVIVDTANGCAEIEVFEAPEAFLGTLSLKCVETVGCADLERFRQVSGLDEYGIIGMDFLRRYVVQLDSDGGTVALLKSTPPSAGSPVLITYDGDAPFVEAKLPELGSRVFLLDTGYLSYGSGSLPFDDFRLLMSRRSLKSLRGTLFMDLFMKGQHERGTLTQFEIGRFRHENLDFSEGRTGTSGSAGILGLTFLERYNVTFDFPGHLMYLRKSKRFNDPELRDLSGLHLFAQNGRIAVDAVDQDGLAAKAAIKAHDVIRRVDGKEALPMNLNAIRRTLCSPRKTVRLTIERDKRIMEITLKLDPIPETVTASDVSRKPSLAPKTR